MAETVFAAFKEAAEQGGAAEFLVVPSEEVTLCYSAALRAVHQLVERYRDAGYGHGHRVALLLENRPAFLLHWLALNLLGIAVVPINPFYRRRELAHLLSHSGVTLAVILGERVEDVQAANNIVAVMDVDEDEIPPSKTAPPLRTDPNGESLCGLLYTSGTTGEPKGCLLSNDYYLRMGRWYLALGGLCTIEPGKERLLTPLPLYHMNAMACSFMAMIMSRGCLIQLDRFHPATWWKDVAGSGATIVHYLGVMPAILLGLESCQAEQDHQVRFGFGANADPVHHATFEARFGFPLIEAWAMTETGAGACIAANQEPRHLGTRCFGKAKSCDVKIVDEDGDEVSTGEDGEMLVRHNAEAPRAGFFSGYHGDELASEQAWQGGWFHTGDVVREGVDGCLHFVDRRKNVIRRSGENIAALEVESMILELDWVAQVAVIAAPDELRGEEVMACIVPQSGAPHDEVFARQVSDWCLENLSYYKAPGWVAFRETLPVTVTQKIQKAELQMLGYNPATLADCYDLRDRKRP